MLVYLTLAACALLTAVIIYRYDLAAREPWPLLFLAVVLGAFDMWLAGRSQIAILQRAGTADFNLYLAAAAAVTEELGKLLPVALIALIFRRHFEEPLDGVIYGAFAGLGAALLESVVHLVAESPSSLPPGEPIRLAGHLLFGGIGAFGLGMYHVHKRAWPLFLLGTLSAAVMLHFLWDVIAFNARDAGRMTPRLTTFGIALMITGMVLFRWFVAIGSRLGRARVVPAPVVASTP